MGAYYAGLLAGTFFAGFLGPLALCSFFRLLFGGERFRFVYPVFFLLPFLLILSNRYSQQESMNIGITLVYLAGANLYFFLLYRRERKPLGKAAMQGSLAVVLLGCSVSPFLNLRYGERTFIEECVVGGRSNSGFLGVLNSYSDAAGFCRCVRPQAEPAACYEKVGLAFSAEGFASCRLAYQQSLANPEVRKAYQEAQDGCIFSQLGAQSAVVLERVRDVLQESHVQVLLADANLKALQVSEQNKINYGNCFIGKVLADCAAKNLRGYSLCLEDGQNPKLKAYVEECRPLLAK